MDEHTFLGAVTYFSNHEQRLIVALMNAVRAGLEDDAEIFRETLDGFLSARRGLYALVAEGNTASRLLNLTGEELGRALIETGAKADNE